MSFVVLIVAIILSIPWAVATFLIGRSAIKRFRIQNALAWPMIWLASSIAVSTDTAIGLPYAMVQCKKLGGYRQPEKRQPAGIFFETPSPYQSFEALRWPIQEKPHAFDIEPGDIGLLNYLITKGGFIEKSVPNSSKLVRWSVATPGGECADKIKNPLDTNQVKQLIKHCIHEEEITAISAEARLSYKKVERFGLPDVEEISIRSSTTVFSSYTWVYHVNRSYIPLHQFVLGMFLPGKCDCKLQQHPEKIIADMILMQ